MVYKLKATSHSIKEKVWKIPWPTIDPPEMSVTHREWMRPQASSTLDPEAHPMEYINTQVVCSVTHKIIYIWLVQTQSWTWPIYSCTQQALYIRHGMLIPNCLWQFEFIWIRNELVDHSITENKKIVIILLTNPSFKRNWSNFGIERAAGHVCLAKRCITQSIRDINIKTI